MEATRIEARDDALRLLNRLTFWVGAAALAAVGVFAAVSAATIPGSASTSTTTSTSSSATTIDSGSSASSSSSATAGSLQPLSGGVSAAPSGSGMVATGASR